MNENEIKKEELSEVAGGEGRYTDKYCAVCHDMLKTRIEKDENGNEKVVTYCPVCGWISDY